MQRLGLDVKLGVGTRRPRNPLALAAKRGLNAPVPERMRLKRTPAYKLEVGHPWYHVLVHAAEHTTYVAESSLETDASGDPIAHPLLGRIFQSFVDGQYHLDSQS